MTDEYKVRELFKDAPYVTNAIGDAFAGASRTHVLLVKAVLDIACERVTAPTYENATAFNIATKALVAALSGENVRSA